MVWLAAEKVGIKGKSVFDHYRLLGDDIILSSNLAPAYEALMTELGVAFSKAKSLSGRCAEFAKRVLIGQDEITPIPIRLLMQCQKDPLLVPFLHEHMLRLPSRREDHRMELRELLEIFSRRVPKSRRDSIFTAALLLDL